RVQVREQRRVSFLLVFQLQAFQNFIQQRQDPAPFETLFGRDFIRRFAAQARLRGVERQRKQGQPSAAFLRPGPIPFIGQETFHRGKQEGTEPSLFRVGTGDPIFFQQPCEKFLRQI